MVSESRKNPDARGPGRPSLKELLALVDEEARLLHQRLGGLPRAVEADQILRAIWIDDVHNSTAIEGNTMTRAQVEELVENRRASASVVETMEVEAYSRAAEWVYRTAGDTSDVPRAVISEIHRIAMELPWAIEPPRTGDKPGDWRRSPVRVGSVKVSLPAAIAPELDEWSKSTRAAHADHPIVRAAMHHAWFERIHPFVDGNGRVGRLLLNFMLLQKGYPPAIILAKQRARYLQALRQADGGNPNALAEVIARAVSQTLSRFLIPGLAGDAKLIPLTALAAGSPYSSVYLRQLVLKGRLRAVRDGRLWLSSRAWLAEYVERKDPRGTPARSARKRRSRGRRAP
jgi:fido (protein-threonine AMPylation protein)